MVMRVGDSKERSSSGHVPFLWRTLLVLSLSIAFVMGPEPRTAMAQESSPGDSVRIEVAPADGKAYLFGGYTTFGFPMGDWGEIAGFGLGIDGTNVVFRNPNRPVAMRSSLGFHYNFARTQEVPSSNLDPNSKLDLETKNASLFFGIGPEIGRATGDVNPFVFGTVGFNTYWTSSNLSGTVGGLPYEARFGDSRIAFAWSAGLGVRRKLADGYLGEISAEFRSGPGHKFLQPDEITNSGPAVIGADRKSRTTNQLIIRVGTLFGT